MSIGAFLQIEVVEVDDVQVLTGPVEMATGDGSIFVDKRESSPGFKSVEFDF